MLSVEVKDLLEADGAIFEAPVSSALLTVAQVHQFSWMNNGIVLYMTLYMTVDTCVLVLYMYIAPLPFSKYSVQVHVSQHTHWQFAVFEELLYCVEVVLL